jgi:hypothetical protein
LLTIGLPMRPRISDRATSTSRGGPPWVGGTTGRPCVRRQPWMRTTHLGVRGEGKRVMARKHHERIMAEDARYDGFGEALTAVERQHRARVRECRSSATTRFSTRTCSGGCQGSRPSQIATSTYIRPSRRRSGGRRSSDTSSVMATRLLRTRHPGRCAGCGTHLPAGCDAWWDAAAKTLTCLSCAWAAAEPDDTSPPANDHTTTIGSGTTGASAQREFDRRKEGRAKRVRADHPRIGGLILALTDEPQSTRAWAKGAEGERRVGERLEELTDNGWPEALVKAIRRPGPLVADDVTGLGARLAGRLRAA